jgi:translocation and assembly module TamA
MALRMLAAGLVLALSACSGKGGLESLVFDEPETAVAYEVSLVGSPSDEITDLAEQSLASYRLQDKGAASIAFLRRRAEVDVPILLKILRSRGYYGSNAEVTVEETGPGEALVTIAAAAGEAFTLVRHDFVIERVDDAPIPPLDAMAYGSPVGKQALAAEIAIAEGAAVAELRRKGYPYAAYADRSGLADPDAATLDLDTLITAGPAVTFGPVRFEGLATVDEDYLRTYQPWKDGETFNTDQLREYQRRLFATDLFAAATVNPPETPPEGLTNGAPLPITVTVEEGKRRRVAASLRYDTDLGPTARASFEHRNLFGANERLLIQGEAGLYEQSFGIGLRKPQFLQPGQDLLTDITLKRTVDDAYDALTATAFAGLERRVNKRWRAGLGVLGEISEIDDEGETKTAMLLGVPAFAAYDGSNDLFDPTRGARLRFEATPFGGKSNGDTPIFLVLDAKGSYYQPLDDESRYVFAVRGRAASILAESLDVIPATRRLYAGGSGSVRGYAQDFIGPLDANDDPVGGRSALEAGAELRARLYGDFGGVIFAGAGTVSTEMFPDFAEDVQTAAGVGFRYYSPAGPIRLDLALPLNPRPVDDAFQVYFSIGQAF